MSMESSSSKMLIDPDLSDQATRILSVAVSPDFAPSLGDGGSQVEAVAIAGAVVGADQHDEVASSGVEGEGLNDEWNPGEDEELKGDEEEEEEGKEEDESFEGYEGYSESDNESNNFTDYENDNIIQYQAAIDVSIISIRI